MTIFSRDVAHSHNATPIHVVSVTSAAPQAFYRAVVKRVVDITLILLSLPLILPLVVLMATLVWLLDGGTPFYRQARVGRDGRTFTMWKLRSMVVDAQDLLHAYLAANPAEKAEWDAKQKLENDPRITRLGRFLRKSSMDELPQLWNVLKGDMSLVGPRPMMPEQRSLYPGRAYFQMRPGITGLWQITDRSKGSFSGRAVLDDAYRARMSFAEDVMILFKTVLIVFRCTGR